MCSPDFGVEVRFAADDRPESIGALIDERTKAVFCETVGNPAGNVIDLAAVAEVAHEPGSAGDRRQHRRRRRCCSSRSVTAPTS